MSMIEEYHNNEKKAIGAYVIHIYGRKITDDPDKFYYIVEYLYENHWRVIFNYTAGKRYEFTLVHENQSIRTDDFGINSFKKFVEFAIAEYTLCLDDEPDEEDEEYDD